MVGKPVIKGARLTVEYVLKFLANGTTFEKILDEYEGLTTDGIYACLLFATKSIDKDLGRTFLIFYLQNRSSCRAGRQGNRIFAY